MQDEKFGDEEKPVHCSLCDWMDFANCYVKSGKTEGVGLKKAGRSPEWQRRLKAGPLSVADMAEVSGVRAPSFLQRCPSLCSGCGSSHRTRPPQAPPLRHPAAI